MTLPFLFIYAHQVRGLSYGTAGLVVSVIALASLLGNPAGGAAADRWTPRRALMAGLVVAAAGSAALALARTAVALFGAASLFGLGVAVIWPAQDALLASLAGPAARSAVFSVRHACLNAGLGLGALGAATAVSVARPDTFVAVYLADAASFLAFVPVLARLGSPARQAGSPDPARPERTRYREVLRDKAFLRAWALTALIVTASFGQFQSSFAGYATRPGGIGTHGLSVAFAANMATVAGGQLFVLRWLGGHRRTTGAALAAVAWAATWPSPPAFSSARPAAASRSAPARESVFSPRCCWPAFSPPRRPSAWAATSRQASTRSQHPPRLQSSHTRSRQRPARTRPGCTIRRWRAVYAGTPGAGYAATSDQNTSTSKSPVDGAGSP